MSIRTSTLNGVLTIEIARPEKKNAITLAMYEAMTAALRDARATDSVVAVLITGQRDLFTAGNDLEDFLQRPPTDEASSPIAHFLYALLEFEKPVVAAVTGAAVGIGVTMLLHCDLVYVSADARLSMPFVSLGIVPEFGSSLLVPRLMGRAKAAEKLLLCEPFSGREAVELGIATAALPAAEVLAYAQLVAERFNHLPIGAVRDAKRLMRTDIKEAVMRAMHAEAAAFLERLRSPEAREAFTAFLQKRKPIFPKQ
jgi:enoyl-CoA hydratase/carnithine racemase